jgi:hypothetical protein
MGAPGESERAGPPFVCAKCGCASDAGSVAEAVTYGWLIDTSSEPPRYLCPACHEALPASRP